MEKTGKDLTKEAPRSAFERMNNFAIIERTIDKCRATLWGNKGEYHFDCPLDNMLFGFKEIKGEDFKKFVEEGHSDQEIADWVKANGAAKTDQEISAWSDSVDNTIYHGDPQKGEWFDGECKRLGLDPEKTSLFQFLDADDKASFAK
jgi:hypothetical protein